MDIVWMVLKVVIIYFVLILILRFLGKREVGQLSIFDLVIILIIADIASIGIDNNEFFYSSILCLCVLAILQKVLSLALLHFASLRNICDGTPTIIVYEGKLQVKNMKKELYTIDDLVSQMRLEHIMDVSEIQMAILETNGTLSLFKKESGDEIFLPIILSGQIEKENIKILDISEERIQDLLKQHKLKLNKIMYASVSDGVLKYYYKNNNKVSQIKQDTIQIESKIKGKNKK